MPDMMIFRDNNTKITMSTYEQIANRLRQHGERITIQRRLVIEALLDTGAHMTINDINAHTQQAQDIVTLSDPTIYRILQWLKDLELVSQTDMAESGIVYQIIDADKHHHLVCLNCGITIDVDDTLFDDMRDQLHQEYEFHARIDHMAIYGYCTRCEADITKESHSGQTSGTE